MRWIELGLHRAQLFQDFQRLRGLAGIDAAHREADMDEHPIADAGFGRILVIDDATDIDLSPHAADIDRRGHLVGVVNANDLARNADTHGSAADQPRGADGRLAQRQPTVIARHLRMVQHANPAAPSRAATLSSSSRF